MISGNRGKTATRKTLLKMREEAATSLSKLEEQMKSQENGGHSNHPADQDNTERMVAAGVSPRFQVLIDQIDKALARLREGSYGLCEGCGCAIPQERLDVRPYATCCIACQKKTEKLHGSR